MATGYVTTTYKMKLECKHLDWIKETKKLYNQVRTFYHALLQEHQELHRLGSQAILRELEKLSLEGRDGQAPEVPLPYERVSAYFRRSAANGAIGSFRTYLKNHERWERERADACLAGNVFQKTEPRPAETFCASPVFYKGMYKEFTKKSITLKLWTGKSWSWVRCKYRGRAIPESAELLSPAVVMGKKKAALHIPVKEAVADVRPVKERIAQGDSLCAVSFTNTDAFAVCSILGVDGRMTASRFIRGGAEYVHHSKRLLDKIRRNRQVLGRRFDWTGCNKRHWEHLNHLSDYWAHKISCQIVDFCKKNGAKVIALVESEYERMRWIARQAGKYSPIYLSLRIRRYLVYKAWKAGIAVTYVKPGYLTNTCSCCGARLEAGKSTVYKNHTGVNEEFGHTSQNRVAESAADLLEHLEKHCKGEVSQGKQKRAERSYHCPNGHQGNRDLNVSRNIGRNCLNKLGKRPA